MTTEEFAVLVGRIREFIAQKRKENALLIASDAAALISDRVQREGKNAEGSDFGIYAPTTQQFKQDTNRTRSPFPAINFTQTGDMWKSIKPVEISEDEGSVRLAIRPTDTFSEKKLRDNVQRFGQIIKLSDQETDLIRLSVRNRYRDMFRNFNL